MSFSLFDDTVQAQLEEQSYRDAELLQAFVGKKSATVQPQPKELTLPEKVAADYQHGLDAAIAAVAELTQPMRAFYSRGFTPFDDALRKLPCSNELNKDMFKVIVREAKNTGLAAPGNYHFDEDFGEYLTGLDRHGSWDEDNTVKVDVLGLCNAIFNAYAGDAGDRIEHNRVARALISRFDLEKKPIEPRKGFVELTHYNYLEKSYRGDYNFCYSSKNTIADTLSNLKYVFGQSNLIVLMTDLQTALRDYHFKVEPNKTVFPGHIGDDPFSVKVFKGELRWKFTEHCIGILGDFVAEHGSEG